MRVPMDSGGDPETGQVKPKTQLAAMTPDIMAAVALYHMNGSERIPERGLDGNEGGENGLFGTRHWVAKATIPEEYPPHMANIELPHETLMFAAVRYHQKFIEISSSDYESCPDFKEIYSVVRTRSFGGIRAQGQKSPSNKGEQKLKQPRHDVTTTQGESKGGHRLFPFGGVAHTFWHRPS